MVTPPTPQPEPTSWTIGQESAAKVLRPFGSASVRKVVADARAKAEEMSGGTS